MALSKGGVICLNALLLLGTLSVGQVSAGPVMAVDLGGEFLKVSVIRPGRPVSIAINELSKRKTSAQVAYVNGERLLGEDAVALSPRYPELVFARWVMLIYTTYLTAAVLAQAKCCTAQQCRHRHGDQLFKSHLPA